MNGFPILNLHNHNRETETKMVRVLWFALRVDPFGMVYYGSIIWELLSLMHGTRAVESPVGKLDVHQVDFLVPNSYPNRWIQNNICHWRNEIISKFNYTVHSFPKPYVRGGRNCTNLFAQLRGTSLSNRTNQNLRSFLIICPIVSNNHRDKTKSLEIVLDKNIARFI